MRGRGQGNGMSRGMSSGRGRNSGGRGRGSSGFDPLACYRCGVRGHLARDYPNTSTQLLTLSGAVLAPLVDVRSNPGSQAQNMDEDVDGKFVSEASTFYTMRTGISIPWTTQDNCTSPWKLGRLLPR